MTSRRSFLNWGLASVAAALVLDPERALWVPGRKLISIPKPAVAKPLSFALGDLITFGGDNNPYRVVRLGDPVTHEGMQFEAAGRFKAYLEAPLHQQWLRMRLRRITDPAAPPLPPHLLDWRQDN